MTKGHVAVKNPIPVKVEAGKAYFWCSCGQSKNQPFCDGTHKVEGKFAPIAWKADEDGEKWFCGCKQTNSAPFCDGSHKKI